MTKVSFIVPCRNKARFVGNTVRSVLAQTYSPMEIILSDQGSTDGTFEIITQLANEYTGPNTVRVLQCPHTEFKGMAGLNLHLNWLHSQIEGDLVIMCSADDLNHPDRVLHTVKAYEEFNPSYIGTCVEYLNPQGETTGYTGRPDGDGFVDSVENVEHLIGSSASSCWTRDLYDKYGPLYMVESQDVLLPFFAILERGLYYIHQPLHAYVQHAGKDNTGLEGVLRSAENETEERALVETVNYHFTSNWFAILRRVQQMGIELGPDLSNAVYSKIVHAGNAWSIARDNLTIGRIDPVAMRV